jgi:3-deoxy-7-phosphoheptulonate synthase
VLQLIKFIGLNNAATARERRFLPDLRPASRRIKAESNRKTVMIVILSSSATERNRQDLVDNLQQRGYGVHVSVGVEKTIIGIIGIGPEEKAEVSDQFEALPFVDRCVPVSAPYKLVGKPFRPEGTTINVRGVIIGGEKAVMMAGPCTVETEDQLMESAHAVKKAGAHILRGGAYKPSTSPYSFHGHGVEALKMLANAREETGLPIITEVMDVRDVEVVCQYADILQIGTRNAQNYNLLREVGKVQTPVLLKRGMSSKIEEWLQAAEYIASSGNYNIMLCERGIRTFETYTRNTFDINAIPALKELSHLPVIADTSHGTGKASLVDAVTLGAFAAGADGAIIEVHPHPEKALKDGAQSLTPTAFEIMMQKLNQLLPVVGRSF